MDKKNLVIFGAGGLGREAAWQISESEQCSTQYKILGFADDDPALRGKEINGYPVLGDSCWLMDYPEEVCVAICVGNPKARKGVYDKIKENPRISFPAILAAGVRLSDSVKLGQGSLICLANVLTTNIEIGEFVIVNYNCVIAHDAVIDDFVTLYSSVNVSGNVRIGFGAEIGVGTDIIQSKTIGANAVIGAGAVVVRDIPPDCTAVGVPAAPVKFHNAGGR